MDNFSHADFQPPSKTYIIQSLLLVEGYEKQVRTGIYMKGLFTSRNDHSIAKANALFRRPSLNGQNRQNLWGKFNSRPTRSL